MPFLGICLLLNQIRVWDELQPSMNSFSHKRVRVWAPQAAARAAADWIVLRH